MVRLSWLHFATFVSHFDYSLQTLTHSLYDLAVHPEYVRDMREEAEKIIEEEGWTKTAMQRMRKVDSFLKESQRLNSIGNSMPSYSSFHHELDTHS
jgi:cytochrome P450